MINIINYLNSTKDTSTIILTKYSIYTINKLYKDIKDIRHKSLSDPKSLLILNSLLEAYRKIVSLETEEAEVYIKL